MNIANIVFGGWIQCNKIVTGFRQAHRWFCSPCSILLTGMISVIYSSPLCTNNAPICYTTGLARNSFGCFCAILWKTPNSLFGQPDALLLENTHYFWSLISCGQQVSWFLLLKDCIILASFLAQFSGMMSTNWCPRSHSSFFSLLCHGLPQLLNLSQGWEKYFCEALTGIK